LSFSHGVYPKTSEKAVQEMTQAEVKVVEKLDMAMIK